MTCPGFNNQMMLTCVWVPNPLVFSWNVWLLFYAFSYVTVLLIAFTYYCVSPHICVHNRDGGRDAHVPQLTGEGHSTVELILSIYCHVGSRDWTGVLRFFNKRVSLLSHMLPSPWFYTGVDHMSHTNTHPPENNFLLYYHRHSALFFRIGDQVVMLCKFPSYLPRFKQPSTRSNGTTSSGESSTQPLTWYQLHQSPYYHDMACSHYYLKSLISYHPFFLTKYKQPPVGHFNHSRVQFRDTAHVSNAL